MSPCHQIVSGRRVVGYVCTSPERVRLARGVWMEWHSYFGPTFFTTRDGDRMIDDWYLRQRIVALFDSWMSTRTTGDPAPAESTTSCVCGESRGTGRRE